jgi:hypothetical protein
MPSLKAINLLSHFNKMKLLLLLITGQYIHTLLSDNIFPFIFPPHLNKFGYEVYD